MNPPRSTPSPPPQAPPNIYIIGAQCTGKTTLVDNLDEYFSTFPNPEAAPPVRILTDVAPTVMRTHNFTARDVHIPARNLALQRLILQAQAAKERDVMIGTYDSGGWFISDRSGADAIAYALQYVGAQGSRALVESEHWGWLKGGMQEGLVVVCEAGAGVAGWLADDGVRVMPGDLEEWVGFHRVFCEFLEGEGVQYEVLGAEVSGQEERVEFVLGRWRARWRERG